MVCIEKYYLGVNLVVDQGNTVCKIAVCDSRGIIEVQTVPCLDRETLTSLLERYPAELSCAIYSSVGAWEDDTPRLLSAYIPSVVVVGADTPVPIAVDYDRQLLGSDRLAVAVGAASLGVGYELLVLDAGTAITYERISSDGVYLGGNISPGLYVRLKAMHTFTNRLPLIHDIDQISGEYGTDTISAMTQGALRGLAYEIEGYIRALKATAPDARVYITGGDAEALVQVLDSKVIIEPDLVLLGLNQILEYNQ